MVGFVITLLLAISLSGVGLWVIERLTAKVADFELDAAARLGLAGLLGLGIAGWLTFPIGLIPGGLRFGLGFILLLALFGAFRLYQSRVALRFERPTSALGLGIVAVLLVGLFFSLVGVLAPSDSLDWDSLAYHLAVPKLWLAAGQIHPISFIHHSHFPFAIDNLYIWGLQYGDQAGAKAFSWCFTLFGLFAIFGLARQRYGTAAGWYAVLAFHAVPVVLWLSGTGYIDVSNGLFAGIGIILAAWAVGSPAARGWMTLASIFLGLAAASKYTGLQTIAAVAAVSALAVLITTRKPSSIHGPVILVVAGLLVASPWYIRNAATTGNPVYPFFYSKLGGANWNDFYEKIYKEEQQTFGAGRAAPTQAQPIYGENKLDPMRLGHSILGLSYQPGRYINPGPISGNGVPSGALGFVALVAALLWAVSGKARIFEGTILGIVGVSLLMWFILSQQSRYIIALTVPLAVLAGGVVTQLRSSALMKGSVWVQAASTLAILWVLLISPKGAGTEGRPASPLAAAFEQVSPTEYQARRIGFYEPAQYLNQAAKQGKVALYDEVFGFLLDVPYFWANPGHTTELGYEQMQTGADLVASLQKQGITHVYLNLSIYPSADPNTHKWRAAMGLDGPVVPFSAEDRQAKFQDVREKWKVLIAEAIAENRLQLAMSIGPRRLVFRMPEVSAP
ncbi:MAG: ArnT family glycosyltransferase [Fimbriimonas sp.]